jgi:hypothetical protein
MSPVSGLDALEDPYSEAEARSALWAMRVDSSPGPDGFGPAFYRAFWDVVRGDVMEFLADFHAGVAPLDGVNRAFTALLPKKADMLTADGFRPISLQNCIMKLVTRILTSRLQSFIERFVAFEQSGFIRGRFIADNFLYAIDII